MKSGNCLPPRNNQQQKTTSEGNLLLHASGLDANAHLHTVALPETSIRRDDRGRGVLGLGLLELRGVGDAADEGSAVDLLDLHVGVDDRSRGIVLHTSALELGVAALDGASNGTLADDLLLGNTVDHVDGGALSLGSRGVLGLGLLELRGVGDAADESSAVDGLELGVRVDDRSRGIVLDRGVLELGVVSDGASNGTLLHSLLLGNTVDHVDGGALSLGSRGVPGLGLLELRGVGDAADESSAVDGLHLGVRVDDGGGGVPGLGLLKFSTLLDFRCNLLHCLNAKKNSLN